MGLPVQLQSISECHTPRLHTAATAPLSISSISFDLHYECATLPIRPRSPEVARVSCIPDQLTSRGVCTHVPKKRVCRSRQRCRCVSHMGKFQATQHFPFPNHFCLWINQPQTCLQELWLQNIEQARGISCSEPSTDTVHRLQPWRESSCKFPQWFDSYVHTLPPLDIWVAV